MRKWRIEDSAELYNINGWGLKYFSINDKGHVAVTPREGSASVDLKELMDELQVRDVTSPVLLRFPDILDNHIQMFSTSSRRIWLHGQKLHHLPHQGQPNATGGGRDRQSR